MLNDFLKAIAIRSYALFFKKRMYNYGAWVNYEIGFTGQGPTALDVKPSFPKPKVPKFVEQEFNTGAQLEKKFRWEAWRQSCIEVMGEDPGEEGEF